MRLLSLQVLAAFAAILFLTLKQLRAKASACAATHRHKLSADHERLICFVLGAGEPTSLAAADKIYAATHRVIVKEGFFAGACEINIRALSLFFSC